MNRAAANLIIGKIKEIASNERYEFITYLFDELLHDNQLRMETVDSIRLLNSYYDILTNGIIRRNNVYTQDIPSPTK